MRVPFNDLSRSKTLSDEFLSALVGVLRSGHYLNGPYSLEFEHSFAKYIGVEHVKVVSSGTSALTLALKALDLPRNAEVLISANAGAYSRIAVEAANLRASYVDVGMDGLIHPEAIDAAMNSETRVVIVTHLYGQMCEMREISEICKRRNLFLIEDCAQSTGAIFEGRRAGSWGDISTFSFYPTKNLAAMGDAGAVGTNRSDLHDRVRMLSQYGWRSKYSIEIMGGENSRMDEIQAFVLLERLKQLEELNQRRREIWQKYESALDGSVGRILGSPNDSYVGHLAVLDVGKRRDEFREYLLENGIETAIHYPIPDHLQSAMRDTSLDLPVTEYLAQSILSIPLFPELEDAEVEYVCKALRAFSKIENGG